MKKSEVMVCHTDVKCFNLPATNGTVSVLSSRLLLSRLTWGSRWSESLATASVETPVCPSFWGPEVISWRAPDTSTSVKKGFWLWLRWRWGKFDLLMPAVMWWLLGWNLDNHFKGLRDFHHWLWWSPNNSFVTRGFGLHSCLNWSFGSGFISSCRLIVTSFIMSQNS